MPRCLSCTRFQLLLHARGSVSPFEGRLDRSRRAHNLLKLEFASQKEVVGATFTDRAAVVRLSYLPAKQFDKCRSCSAAPITMNVMPRAILIRMRNAPVESVFTESLQSLISRCREAAKGGLVTHHVNIFRRSLGKDGPCTIRISLRYWERRRARNA